jgi:hypothetical protein
VKRTVAHTVVHRFSLGLTLIELLVFAAMFVCAFVGAKLAQHCLGGRYSWCWVGRWDISHPCWA